MRTIKDEKKTGEKNKKGRVGGGTWRLRKGGREGGRVRIMFIQYRRRKNGGKKEEEDEEE